MLPEPKQGSDFYLSICVYQLISELNVGDDLCLCTRGRPVRNTRVYCYCSAKIQIQLHLSGSMERGASSPTIVIRLGGHVTPVINY